MNPKTKKIIAREGLVFLGIVLLGFIIIQTGMHFLPYLKITCLENLFEKKCILTPAEELIWGNLPPPPPILYRIITAIGQFLLFLGYPTYLLIRFIIWAIMILLKKEK